MKREPGNHLHIESDDTLRNRYRDRSYEYSQFQADCQVPFEAKARKCPFAERETDVLESQLWVVARRVRLCRFLTWQVHSQIFDNLRK